VAKISFLECTKCGEHISADTPQTICPKDGGSLYVRYDFTPYLGTLKAHDLSNRTGSMWRYKEVLPDVQPVTLGEGATPMIQSRANPNVYIKDEGMNPTGSFKARGLSAAVTMCKHYGLKKIAIPSAGNAASALAAYAAAASIEAHIFMPSDVPMANYLEGVAYGANVSLVDGLISDCARMVAERIKEQRSERSAGRLAPEDVWFDVSTLKEPFRVEGKKTMGYELVEQLGWEYPDAVFYPTGGGVGLIGMWKAFAEMEALSWVRPGKRPKMIAVQASGCAPVARAYQAGEAASKFFENAATFAAGLRVPKPYGDYIILEIVRESGGTVAALDDQTILQSLLDWSKHEGLLLSPEGAAATAAYDQLIETGFLKPSDRVVIFNTGAGLKYTDMTAEAMHLKRPQQKRTLPTSMPVGGIITPQ